MNHSINQKTNTQNRKKYLIQGVGALLLLLTSVAGLLIGKDLLGTSQDIRQQANGLPACIGNLTGIYMHDCGTNMEHCIASTLDCQPYSVHQTGIVQSAGTVLNVSDALHNLYAPMHQPCNIIIPVDTVPNQPGFFNFEVYRTLPEQWVQCGNTYCYCDYGEQTGITGPATCTHPNGIQYPVTSRPGCKPQPTAGSSADCTSHHGNPTACDSVSPSLPGSPQLSAVCAFYTCSNTCLPRGTSNCAAGCGGCTPGGSSGGGAGTPSSPPPINPNRTIAGSVKCTNVLPGSGPFSQPYGIKNAPVVAFAGTQIIPTAVSELTTTDANGNYQLAIQQTNPNVTLRLTTNNRDHDYVFLRDGNPAIQCTDTHAYELCSFFDIATTGVQQVNFKTNSRAESLRGFQSGNEYIFEFTKARNALNQPIAQYIVRLDNTANTWFTTNDPQAPDYFLRVPANIGSCDATKCRITSTQLSAITQFRGGTYAFGVNPILPSQVTNSPLVELCRNFTTITATTPAPTATSKTNRR